MKKTVLLFALIIAMLLPGCGSYDEAYNAGYADGYDDGRTDSDMEWFDYGDERYNEGYDECADDIADMVDEWWEDLDDNYIGNHGYSLSEAMDIISKYISGVPTDHETLEEAFWVLHVFQKDVEDMVFNIRLYN